jgi:Flp pilus assembly pilin Flp
MTAKDKGGKYMEQMKNRKEHEATEKFANGLADEFRAFWADEDGVGVIEVVLILVVLIGLVIIFKTQIRKLLETIFKQIETQSKEVY